jgi:hypothetical protein
MINLIAITLMVEGLFFFLYSQFQNKTTLLRAVNLLSKVKTIKSNMSLNPKAKGLLSFATGGTILFLVLYNIILHPQLDGYYQPVVYTWLLEDVIFGFIGFLLLGYGLSLINKETKNPS